jgi:hypothetical protein
LIQIDRPEDLIARIDRFAKVASRREVKLAPEILRKLVGDYSFGTAKISISLSNERLWLGLPDLPGKPLFAASDTRFFVRTTETEFEFQMGGTGMPAELLILNSGYASVVLQN